MNEELKKDLEFVSEVIEEFAKKHRNELADDGYMALCHLNGQVLIHDIKDLNYRKKTNW